MPPKDAFDLSRRERQIMEIVFASKKATVSDVLDAMSDPLSYSSVRALMRILEDKGHLKHRKDGVRYVYGPTKARHHAARAATDRVLNTFFGGNLCRCLEAMLDIAGNGLSRQQVQEIRLLIEKAQGKGRG